jgi:hypothetical protein
MKTFLVVPDKFSGGPLWNMVVRALTARDACQAVRTHLKAHDEIVDFSSALDGEPGADLWGVWEFPSLEGAYGVIPWGKFKRVSFAPVYREGVVTSEGTHAA